MMWCDDLHGVGETDRSCCDWLTLETLILGTSSIYRPTCSLGSHLNNVPAWPLNVDRASMQIAGPRTE